MKHRHLPYALATMLGLLGACSSDDKTSHETNTDESTADDDTSDDTDSARDAGKNDAGRSGNMDGGALDGSVRSSSDAGDAGQGASSTDGQGALDATVSEADSKFAACVQALKPTCSYDEKETSCAAVTTPSIPLTDGGTYGNKVIPGGPYGAYVEWNQGMAFANTPSLLESSCNVLAASFGEPASTTSDILDLRGADLSLYTVFRPACMKDGETYPVITWGNGTCGQTGGYATQLATLASHGFVVFASNSRFTDGGNNEMLRALDFAKATQADSTSPLYQKLDLDHVGAMGHSQGASATSHASTDPRIDSLILWNGGTSLTPAKPFLAVSGDRDIGTPTIAGYQSYVNGAKQPGAWLYYHQVLETGGNVTGHLTLMEQPDRVIDVTVAWWKYMLKSDADAKKTFVGNDCTLCSEKTQYEYGAHDLP